ncbi:hypothetical protein OTU49_012513 [Cherax quadricarinatus]|uniref:phosphoethanolamine N-methyltransferase n=1 Tax=Cherax quadricarinatus TaxID=27406 RepID=A0AAW0YL98_CHEQU
MDNKAIPTSQQFLDTNQYSHRSILRYERIFGHTWVSTGGETTTKDFLIKLGLRPGQQVLDVGCGTGGSAFFMARYYGVYVHGIDLSSNMINLAQERLAREDVNVSDKRWLKPGGTLFVTDYCRGDRKHSQEFLDYVKQRGYDLRTVREYEQVLQEAGYTQVEAVDLTKTFISILTTELMYFEPTREAFIKDYSEEEYNEIVDGWKRKVIRCTAGDQAWGMFLAIK